MGSLAPVNPFATSRTRPGAIAYLFPDRQTPEALLARLKSWSWRGAIIGPHGSGKSTLLAFLSPLWRHWGRRPLSVALQEGQRRLPATFLADAVDSSTQLIVDGYEQLGLWQQHRLQRFCQRKGCGLLVTSHRAVAYPTLYRTYTDERTLSNIIRGLVPPHEWTADPALLSRLMASHQGNVREILFYLYDVMERQRQQHS